MAENVEPLEMDNEDTGDGKRQRSAIAFPYTDYDNVESIVRAIHENVGHGDCSGGQLAAWTQQSSKSSGFRVQLSAARLFGVIESGNESDTLRLTDLGRHIMDPNKARGAKAEAFLRVPLFKALYEKYRDGVTPPSAALEREILGLGVGEKQKSRARQIFESSAQQTGFREAAPNRLVRPAVAVRDVPPPPDKPKTGGGDGGGDLNLDPLLMALLRKIPPTQEGWPAERRLRWFKTFAMNVSEVYDGENEPVELTVDVKNRT